MKKGPNNSHMFLKVGKWFFKNWTSYFYEIVKKSFLINYSQLFLKINKHPKPASFKLFGAARVRRRAYLGVVISVSLWHTEIVFLKTCSRALRLNDAGRALSLILKIGLWIVDRKLIKNMIFSFFDQLLTKLKKSIFTSL